jgi:O-antigen/teichoic acid export membrane protein
MRPASATARALQHEDGSVTRATDRVAARRDAQRRIADLLEAASRTGPTTESASTVLVDELVADPTGAAPTPAPETAAAGDQLGSRAARGAGVTLVGQAARMLLQLASVVVLARLLLPRDYGLVAEVLVIVGIGEIFRDFGLTNAVVQAPSLSLRQQRGVFWISTGIGVVLSGLVFLAAPLVADLFGQPDLRSMTQVLALTFTINGLAAQYRAHLTRELRFARLALSDVLGQGVGLTVAIVLAALGAGRWALVAQQLSQLTTVLVLVVAFSGWLPGRPRRNSDIGRFVRLGSNLAATQLIWYLSNNLDTVTIGLRFSSASLGLYNRGFQLLMTPLNQMRTPATTVAVPILSRLQADYERAGEYLKRGQVTFGYTLVPALALVVGASSPIVSILLGPRWSGVDPILSFLAVAAGCETLAYIGFWVYVSRGLATNLMRYTMITLVLQGSCIVVGSIWGVTGVAAGYATAAVLEWPLSLVWLSRITPIPVRALLTAAGRILACAVPAGVAAAVASRAVDQLPAVASLAAALAAVGLVYVTAFAISATVRSDLAGVLDFARRMVRR